MKILKYISKIIQFLKSLNRRTNGNVPNQDNYEITHTRFGINLHQPSVPNPASNSLLFHMYSEENEFLFI
ncbi:hypothetical protein [Flavobacterium psychrotolerans]|uniref:Uncharacterized protein n=1 Tax=Flavobacterium psychrotolerans TaxID=2169410 RepID=A0A2U1JMT8_9FLAO|nr:hypothetical protein [Flavobacterium psychrotolerans]PWA06452.1 hypothetical protein DB895_03250 [Flavobacterium psychrotolerans]